jgi:hypothetical protein
MKQLNLTVLNINHCCNYNSVYTELKEFLKNFILKDSYYNIVLTVTIRRVNNTSSLLINNLSIKLSDFDLLFARIKNKLDLIDRHSIYSITFSINSSINKKYIYRFIITVLISLIIILIFFYLSHLLISNAGEIARETYFTFTNISTDKITDNVISTKERNFSIFNPFIDLFSKSNSIYNYSPSYFVSNKSNFLLNSFISVTGEAQNKFLMTSTIRDETVSMVINKDYFNIKYDNYKYYCLLNDLSNIISEYIKSNKSLFVT